MSQPVWDSSDQWWELVQPKPRHSARQLQPRGIFCSLRFFVCRGDRTWRPQRTMSFRHFHLDETVSWDMHSSAGQRPRARRRRRRCHYSGLQRATVDSPAERDAAPAVWTRVTCQARNAYSVLGHSGSDLHYRFFLASRFPLSLPVCLERLNSSHVKNKIKRPLKWRWFRATISPGLYWPVIRNGRRAKMGQLEFQSRRTG